MTTFGAKGNSVYAGGAVDYANARKAFKVKTATNLRAGVFVERDGSDEEIKVGTSGSKVVIGVLTEINHSNPEWDPTTAPAVGDIIDVLLVGHAVKAWVRNDANLLMGAAVMSGTNGRTAASAEGAVGDINKRTGRTLMDHDGSGTEGDILIALGGN